MFTQPLMYQKIRTHDNVFKHYTDKLLKENLVQEKDIDVRNESFVFLIFCRLRCDWFFTWLVIDGVSMQSQICYGYFCMGYCNFIQDLNILLCCW